ncbi:MAG: hypothetical protein V4751_13120 [Pseudomonadota bacterium]
MRKDWEFQYKGNQIRIQNPFFQKAKLYIDGDKRDDDTTMFPSGKFPNLSARMGDGSILEVYAISKMWSVEIKVLIRSDNRTEVIFDSQNPRALCGKEACEGNNSMPREINMMILWAVLCAATSLIFIDSLINTNEFNAIAMIAVVCTLFSFISKKMQISHLISRSAL